MIVARKDISIALLIAIYSILATFGKDIGKYLSEIVGGNPDVTPHDIWATIVLLVFVMSSLHARLAANSENNRNQLLTFLISLGLIIGIAISTSRYITIYFAFIAYFFFFLPIFTYNSDNASEPNLDAPLLFSFLAYCVMGLFIAACLGFLLQVISLSVINDMRAFGVTPPAIAILVYEILIANGHHITHLEVVCPDFIRIRWKQFVYGFAAIINGLYGFFWLGKTISLESFGRFVSFYMKEYSEVIVSIVSFVLVFSFSITVFILFENLRKNIQPENRQSLLLVHLSKYDFFKFILAGIFLGAVLAVFAILGAEYSTSDRQEQIFGQVHLLWVDGILGGLILVSLVLTEKIRKKFI